MRTNWTVDVTVKPDAPAGAVQLTVENEVGKARAADESPSIVTRRSRKPASPILPAPPQPVKLPVTIAGSIDRAGDADYFRFEAKAGEQVGVQVVAAELGSKLEPFLTLTDAAGAGACRRQRRARLHNPEGGQYSVGIRDREYRGAAEMTYRLPHRRRAGRDGSVPARRAARQNRQCARRRREPRRDGVARP